MDGGRLGLRGGCLRLAAAVAGAPRTRSSGRGGPRCAGDRHIASRSVGTGWDLATGGDLAAGGETEGTGVRREGDGKATWAASEKEDDRGLVLLCKTADELERVAIAYGQPKYRGKQLLDGVLRGARSVDTISTIPKSWRQQLLAEGVRTGRSRIHQVLTSQDGTAKFLLQLVDGRVVETVGIPAEKPVTPRLTVCVSSQVGCPLRCTFCATGKGGFARNLQPHEIVDQVLTVQEEMGRRVSNVVFMGMGEPMLNLRAVVHAFKVINKDIGIGARSITISTVGVPNTILMLAKHKLQVTLAVSLHAAYQELREQLVPSAKAYPLQALMQDCRQYHVLTGRRVTFEYTLMAGVNDSTEDAHRLVSLLRRTQTISHVNLIQWNPVEGMDFKRPNRRSVEAFVAVLKAAGVPVSVRASRGLEAAAACGQLSNAHQKTPLAQFGALS